MGLASSTVELERESCPGRTGRHRTARDWSRCSRIGGLTETNPKPRRGPGRPARLGAGSTTTSSRQHLLKRGADYPDYITAGINHCLAALGRYGPPIRRAGPVPAFRRLSQEEQQRIRDRLTETCVLLARGQDRRRRDRTRLRTNRLAEKIAGAATPRVVWEQRASLLSRDGKAAEAKEAMKRADSVPLRTATDYFLSGSAALTGGRYNDALKSLSRAVELEPGFYRAHMALGACQDRLMKYSDAAASFTTAISLWPDVWWGYYHRGLVLLKQGNVPKARADFDLAAELEPKRAEILIHRAIASQSLKDYPAAIRDLDRALELAHPGSRPSPYAPVFANWPATRTRPNATWLKP